MEHERITERNENIIGKTFASWRGIEATYINNRKAPKGFRILCESTPHHAWDHIVYGIRVDGQYVGVGQPYPMGADSLCEVNNYCHLVGLDMTITAESTWSQSCIRILFQRDDNNIERFNIAVNCSRWRGDYPTAGNTNKIIDGVDIRFGKLKRVV